MPTSSNTASVEIYTSEEGQIPIPPLLLGNSCFYMRKYLACVNGHVQWDDLRFTKLNVTQPLHHEDPSLGFWGAQECYCVKDSMRNFDLLGDDLSSRNPNDPPGWTSIEPVRLVLERDCVFCPLARKYYESKNKGKIEDDDKDTDEKKKKEQEEKERHESAARRATWTLFRATTGRISRWGAI